jgi:hypothetical protein
MIYANLKMISKFGLYFEIQIYKVRMKSNVKKDY